MQCYFGEPSTHFYLEEHGVCPQVFHNYNWRTIGLHVFSLLPKPKIRLSLSQASHEEDESITMKSNAGSDETVLCLTWQVALPLVVYKCELRGLAYMVEPVCTVSLLGLKIL